MANEFEKIAEDVLHGIEAPFKFVVKAEKVLQTAITEQPELKSVLTVMVQKAEEVGAAAVLAGSADGLDLSKDVQALQQAQAFFEWFKATVVPLVEKVYEELKGDVSAQPA